MERRLFKGYAVDPPSDGGMAELQQTLAIVQSEAEILRQRDSERAGEMQAARDLIASLQRALAECHEAVLMLINQPVVEPGEGAPTTLLRFPAELAVSGLILVGKQTRVTDCAGLLPGDNIMVTPKGDVPAPLIFGAARCAVAGKLRLDVGALVLITLGQVTIPLDVLVFRE